MIKLPAGWYDPLVLGDLKTGVEALEAQGLEGEVSLALVWIAGIPASQQQSFYTVGVEDASMDDRPIGNWTVSAIIEGVVKIPDPAMKKALIRDGIEIIGVAESLDSYLGPDPLERARRISTTLLIRRGLISGNSRWVWVTPLGRKIQIQASRIS